MGIHMTVFGARRSSFEELADTTIRDLAGRAGLSVRDYSPQIPRFEACPPYGEPVLEFDDADVTIRAHLARQPADALFLLSWLSTQPWSGIATLIDHSRRWWVGSLAHALGRHGFRNDPAVAPCFASLRALAGGIDTGCPWFDRMAPMDAGVFDLSHEPDLYGGEIDGGSLRPLLEAAAALDRFEPPPGPVGIAPRSVAEWTSWVSKNVASLAAAVDHHLVSIVF